MSNSKLVSHVVSYARYDIRRVIDTYVIIIVEDSLKEIQEQTNTALTNVSAQSEKVNDSLSTLQETLKKLEESDNNKEEEFKSIKEDVEVIKGLIPKVGGNVQLRHDILIHRMSNLLYCARCWIVTRMPKRLF
jgi:peroxin-14